jgi:nicotinamidase-related amidase
MDAQRGVVERSGNAAVLDAMARAVGAARAAGIPVIHVVVGFRPGYPEVSPRNRTFAGIRAAGRFTPEDPGAEIHPAVAPAPGEPVVTKHRVSAFSGSDLDTVLRAASIETLALSGIATSGVVLSTLRQAADLDFRCVVLADACADPDPLVHQVLLERVFPRQADVLRVAEWSGGLGG